MSINVCLILIGYRATATRKLVIVANRDEYFARPTQSAAFWNDHPHVYAGRDLEQMGTWLGITDTGRFAALANWTDQSNPQPKLRSRGKLVGEFLIGNESARKYARSLEGEQYQGFNLVLFDGSDLVYTSNRIDEVRELEPGIHAMTNTQLDDTWPRAVNGAKKLEQFVAEGSTDAMVEALYDSGTEHFSPQPEKQNAPCFILGELYGTRSTAAVILNGESIEFTEQTYGPVGHPQHNSYLNLINKG